MHLRITPSADSTQIELSRADEFTAFDVEVIVPPHLWVDTALIVELAGERGDDPAWRSQLEAMTAYAASKGWVDERGRIRAHVLRVDG